MNINTERTYRRIVMAALMLAVCSMNAAAQPEEKVIEVRARKFTYEPHIIHVNKGDRVRIRLISEDVHHGFYLDGYGIETSAIPGEEGTLVFTADKTGRHSFRCSVTCGEFHPYMVGHLVVGPNSRLRFFILLAVVICLANVAWIWLLKTRRNNEQEG